METKVIQRKRKTRGILISVVIILILAIITPIYLYNNFIKSPVSSKSMEVEIQVRKGTSTSAILNELKEKGVIKNTLFAKIYVRKLNIDKSLRAGIYKFNGSMTPEEIFAKLKKGAPDVDVVSVTIPEGLTVRQIAEKMQQLGVIGSSEDFMKEAQTGSFDYEFIKQIPENRPVRLEGYLFPDTYEFRKGSKDHDVIAKLLDRFEQIYENSLKGKIPEGTTLDKIVIMASIVEEEAKLKEEKPVIAGVFYNRLKLNIPFGSDPTVGYALGTHKTHYTLKDIQVDSPYNTYKYPGLPAGPIACPGKESMEAALNPAQTEYLYFYGFPNGSHKFAKTYQEHLKIKREAEKGN